MSAIRLENMILSYTGHTFNFERFNRITPALLQASCTTTLRQLWVDAVLAVPLMRYGICLQNVTGLKLFVDYSQLQLIEPRILGIIKNFDFTRLLPSLSIVVVVSLAALNGHLPADVSAFIDQADTVLGEPKTDRAVNIKHLILYDSLFHVASQYFAGMFPSAEALELDARDGREFSFGSICQHWAHLKWLKVKIRRAPSNLDSFFCGIFPGEVANLRQEDEEYLKKVNIVPVMPAITCLRNLKAFTLDADCFRDAPAYISKVTGLIAFSRCPNLTVTLPTGITSV